MLTGVSVLSLRTSDPSLDFSIVDAANDTVQLQDIQGLGPVKATINTTPFGSVDGELYNGSSIGSRNIVMTFGLNPQWNLGEDMATLRATLYDYFMSKAWVRLTLTSTHMPDVQIDGYVESFEPNMFSKDPEIQVSIICPQPNFIATAPTVVGDTVKATSADTPLVIDYEGSLPVGFLLDFGSTSPVTPIVTVKNTAITAEQLIVTAPATITATRKFTLSTVQGNKYVRLMTGDVVNNNMLSDITEGMKWPQLIPGSNDFIVAATVLPDSPWSMSYIAQYGGI